MKQLFDQEKFAADLRVAIAAKNIDMLQASKEIGCAHSTISRICSAGRAPDVENYLRIMKWMDKQPVRVSVRPRKIAFSTPSIDTNGVETYDMPPEAE